MSSAWICISRKIFILLSCILNKKFLVRIIKLYTVFLDKKNDTLNKWFISFLMINIKKNVFIFVYEKMEKNDKQ